MDSHRNSVHFGGLKPQIDPSRTISEHFWTFDGSFELRDPSEWIPHEILLRIGGLKRQIRQVWIHL